MRLVLVGSLVACVALAGGGCPSERACVDDGDCLSAERCDPDASVCVAMVADAGAPGSSSLGGSTSGPSSGAPGSSSSLGGSSTSRSGRSSSGPTSRSASATANQHLRDNRKHCAHRTPT